MTDAFFDNRPSFMCVCGHKKNRHWNTRAQPNGPCQECACRAFDPEPLCACGHGKKTTTSRTATAKKRTSADAGNSDERRHDVGCAGP